MIDVSTWLQNLGLGHYEAVFVANDIDGEVLRELTDADLQTLGVSLGHRKRLLKAIAGLSDAAAPSHAPEAERRHLTVMFCDLVGSTALAERLDPEDFREVILKFQVASAGVVSRYEGTVAKYLGDGVLIYFGYPRAHEDDAERAVRAALGVVTAIGGLDDGAGGRLCVRIGIATGLVVVGDIVGEGAAQEQAVVGETPNLAARLQGIAAANAVVIGPSTRELLGRQFQYADLGAYLLKGISEPVRVWQVIGEGAVETRFGATRSERLTKLVGRDQEVDLLLERWMRAHSGEGQLMLLSGEAGIGKSRIAATLHERLAGEDFFSIQYQCSPHHVNSPLYPAIQQLEFAAGFTGEDTADWKLDKLERLLAKWQAPRESVLLMAMLLSIPVSGRYVPLGLAPAEQKQKTLRSLVALFAKLAAQRPLLFVLEDAHWIDPTTRELMDLLIERAGTLRALILVTHRPEFSASWSAYAHSTTLTLNRLGRGACQMIVRDLIDGREIPPEVFEQIATRTDGIPLFVEELTKTVLESGLLAERGNRYELTGPLAPLAIPATLHDSLMARLDRLKEAKEIAQIGAAIGREFSYAMIEAVSPLKGRQLDEALEVLRDSEIVFRRGTPPEATYVFKHALIQDTAYESPLRSRRQQIHERIAAVLEARFPDLIESEPEMLAHHFTRAGSFRQAAPKWLLAGQRAVARSANREAIPHLAAGLEVLRKLPSSAEMTGLELDIQISLGSAWIANRGYSAAETEAAYARARELMAGMGEDSRRYPVLHGLGMVYVNRGEHRRLLEVGQETLDWADRQSDALPRLSGHRVLAVGYNFLGRFDAARMHAQQAVALYDIRLHHDTAHQFGHDVGVGAWWHLSIAEHFLGDYPAALNAAEQARILAGELNNANTTLYGQLWDAYTRLQRADNEGARRVAEVMIDEAAGRSMSLWVAFGRHLLGSALAALGRHAAALDELRRGQEEAEQLTNVMLKLMGLCFEARALLALGQADEALARLDTADRHIATTAEAWWEPEVHRLRGEILLQGDSARAAGEACLQRAIAVARAQKSRLFELRAATRLGRLWQAEGREEAVAELLAPLCEAFPAGFDNDDLGAVRALLAAE